MSIGSAPAREGGLDGEEEEEEGAVWMVGRGRGCIYPGRRVGFVRERNCGVGAKVSFEGGWGLRRGLGLRMAFEKVAERMWCEGFGAACAREGFLRDRVGFGSSKAWCQCMEEVVLLVAEERVLRGR